MRPFWMSGPTGVRVIIPTFNEEGTLARCLRSLAEQTFAPAAPLIADGGSTDGTASIARQWDADWLSCQRRGRGRQVAEALAQSGEDIVLIGHADMRFARTSIERLVHALQAYPRSPGGCLGHRFDTRSAGMRFVEWGDWLRACFRKVSYGDQAQFFRRSALEPVGGYPAQPLMEDLELAYRLRRVGPPLYVNVPVTVSARRFQKDGFWRTLWRNHQFRREYERNGSAACESLFRRYYESVPDNERE